MEDIKVKFSDAVNPGLIIQKKPTIKFDEN